MNGRPSPVHRSGQRHQPVIRDTVVVRPPDYRFAHIDVWVLLGIEGQLIPAIVGYTPHARTHVRHPTERKPSNLEASARSIVKRAVLVQGPPEKACSHPCLSPFSPGFFYPEEHNLVHQKTQTYAGTYVEILLFKGGATHTHTQHPCETKYILNSASTSSGSSREPLHATSGGAAARQEHLPIAIGNVVAGSGGAVLFHKLALEARIFLSAQLAPGEIPEHLRSRHACMHTHMHAYFCHMVH